MNKHLKDYTAQPDPEVWERIEKTLHRRALSRKWTRIGAATAVVAAVVAVVVFVNPATKPGSSVPVTPVVAHSSAEIVPTPSSTPAVAEPKQQTISVGTTTLQQRNDVIAEARIAQPPVPTVQPETPANVETSTVSEPVSIETRQSTATEMKAEPVVTEAVQPATTPSQDPASVAIEPQQPTAKATTSSNDDTILWIPNAFAPASDNESITIFRPRLNRPGEKLADYRMVIFNRSGMQVFHSNDINQGWNGTYNGRPLSQGTYVYVIYYTDNNRLRHQRKGTVTLIR